MVEGGINDILVSNEVVGRVKLERLAALAKKASVAVCTDNADNVKALGTGCRFVRCHIYRVVEIDVGGKHVVFNRAHLR